MAMAIKAAAAAAEGKGKAKVDSDAGIVTAIEPMPCAASKDEVGPVEWLQTVTARISMYMHPSRAASVDSGVREVLNSLLLKYDETYDGVVLAYLHTKMLKFGHKIIPLLPYFSIRMQADLLLFAPKAGMIIEGKVNKVEKDYIGMLVLGLFNAAIGVNDIRQDLFFNESSPERAWVSESDERHCITIGTRVSFLVKSVQEEDEFIDITGSLVPPNTGSLDWLACLNEPIEDQEDQPETSKPPKQKKHKHKKRKRDEDEDEGKERENP